MTNLIEIEIDQNSNNMFEKEWEEVYTYLIPSLRHNSL